MWEARIEGISQQLPRVLYLRDSSFSVSFKASAAIKCFDDERKWIVGGLMSPAWVSPWCVQPGAPALPLGLFEPFGIL